MLLQGQQRPGSCQMSYCAKKHVSRSLDIAQGPINNEVSLVEPAYVQTFYGTDRVARTLNIESYETTLVIDVSL